MKREIKFRAWIEETWNETDDYVEPMTIQQMIHSKESTFSLEQLNDLVDFEQFTGLHDKNGREIYEGDLFEHRFGYVVLDEPPHDEMGTECGVVVLEDGQFGVKIPGLGVYNLYGLLLREGHLDNMPKDDLFVMKIAGNIYENPELLEAKQ
ncbi:YopX family protein [Lacticaseibacillus paracasei]|uniref:YopX family protein n=1 Tax=Lacticaseibacillus paracasei TaxID=1597 RepID=UPI0031F6A680